MKNLVFGYFLLPALILSGCKMGTKPDATPEPTQEQPQTAPEVPETPPSEYENTGDNSRVSLDWDGTYRGTLPCEDCDGVQTSLTLFENGDFTRTRIYTGKPDPPKTDNGHFEWNDAGSAITLTSREGEIHRYQVGENLLFQLDAAGSRITGEEAEKYRLGKIFPDPELEDHRWVLTELRGREIQYGADERRPHLTFHSALGQLTGNNGCNPVVADYTLQRGNRIRLSRIASTLKECPGTDLPDQLREVLETLDNYAIKDGVLSLNKARMAPLARFVLED